MAASPQVLRATSGAVGEEFRTGRKLAAADLQLVILALLEQRPSHGYELIKLLEERSAGYYSPSPGVIYPALTYLEEIGYLQSEAEGSRKRYQLTAEGLQHLKANRATVDAILEGLLRVGAKMQRVREVFSGEEEESSGFGLPGGGPPDDTWHQARRVLHQALHRMHHATPEERQRIAAILRRAAEEILGE